MEKRMEISNFFKWVSERYPLCLKLITDNTIPEFDNLYLDMSGIILNCSHNYNDSAHFHNTEEQILLEVFQYIVRLFSRIKPKRLFYLAVDGVAPRARINQQRSYRFRDVKEAEENRQKALSRGEELPEEDAFDSNCITPGTDFMKKLAVGLRYFINKKVSEDEDWRGVEIVFSGPEVPGEGKHKIMEYIRLQRAQSNYDSNTRHCLYGLDADLVILGLLSHELHFALLCDIVVFAKNGNPTNMLLNDKSFYLMHLSIIRKYLKIEFESLRGNLNSAYDFERILDDFILLTLFVDNTLLPHLLTLHINEGALDLMFKTYKKVLPTCGGYLQDFGRVDLARFQKLLDALPSVIKTKSSKTEEDSYYMEKMHIDINNKEQMDGIVGSYIVGILWVLQYYYKGVASWGWFYPYHYCPKISDLVNIERFKDYSFELGQPFKPYEQLMCVLPSLSKKLLPKAYQDLMIENTSPIIDFYPTDFDLDMNGNKHDWETVVKIPFIDEKRLLDAMKSKESQLTPKEGSIPRNGTIWCIYFDKELEKLDIESVPSYKSPLPHLFQDIHHCLSREEPYHLPTIPSSNEFANTINEHVIPIQMVKNPGSHSSERPPQPIEENLSLGSTVFLLESSYLGKLVTISGYSDNGFDIEMMVSTDAGYEGEPDYGYTAVRFQERDLSYISTFEAQRLLSIKKSTLSRLASNLAVKNKQNKPVTVGLYLKSESSAEKAPGYTRKHQYGHWEYSKKAIELLRKFITEFPDFIKLLEKNKIKGEISVYDFTWTENMDEELMSMLQWKIDNKINEIGKTKIQTERLEDKYVKRIEDLIRNYTIEYQKIPLKKLIVREVPRSAFLKPGDACEFLNNQKFNIGNRIVYVSNDKLVPLGLRGTVVGIEKKHVEVLFDHAIHGDKKLYGSHSLYHGLSIPFSSVLKITSSPRESPGLN